MLWTPGLGRGGARGAPCAVQTALGFEGGARSGVCAGAGPASRVRVQCQGGEQFCPLSLSLENTQTHL